MKKDKKIKREKSNKLLPSHYYIINDRVIFTEEFHLMRGQCCGNGCLHCPYEPRYQKGNTTIKK